MMSIDEKIRLVKEVGEEILEEEELRELFARKEHPVAYDGFEPSGRIHLAQGLMRAINVNKMTKAGIHFKFWVADWFALMNNKMGGDLTKIRTLGEYFIEVWKACGMDLDNVEFLWASEHMDQEYWLRVLQIGRVTTVARATRCSQIMGRSENESLSAAQLFYPCMQVSDIFQIGADIAQLGMDQRKANVLARELAPKLGHAKPIIVSHHMLMGLQEPKTDLTGTDAAIAKKMSKSKPDSAIFMTDTEEEVKNKFAKAYCPQEQVNDNPVLEYFKYIIFERCEKVVVHRPEKFGGNAEFSSYKELESAYTQGSLHPLDLKSTAAYHINQLLEPVREHFTKDKKAKKLQEQVESFLMVTR